jgi:hypothetical protein
MIPGAIIITSSNVAVSLHADWDSVTVYSVGTKVYLPSNYGEYQALSGNTDKSPALSINIYDAQKINRMLEVLGTTNKFRMFDQFLNTQTSRQNDEVSIAWAETI